LRRSLGGSGGIIERQGNGYALAIPLEHVDASRFEVLAARSRRVTASLKGT
jgi:DNA-binding SARP family transcriptional activator